MTDRPLTPDEFAGHTVIPLRDCPHLTQVAEIPETGVDAFKTCNECNIQAEVWTCLTCYQSHCGRFVNEHAIRHYETTNHPMALSLADLSAWCYPCESYVHNPVLTPAKSSAHESKFGNPTQN
ncbi:unnamed protein product [Caenorhabditis angaria]|uniref:UBP-type domain-containing protein n=1 Tax=Caenorhabditis angaria TaxID=860376 RepID=A0A9P1INC4_9PELO|nr:unnamed protein product [Caenorhabditis angaria]